VRCHRLGRYFFEDPSSVASITVLKTAETTEETRTIQCIILKFYESNTAEGFAIA
jgi:hypothetical protein